MPIIDWLFAVDIEILCIGSTNPLIGCEDHGNLNCKTLTIKSFGYDVEDTISMNRHQ